MGLPGDLPSGAWVVIGALVALIGTALTEYLRWRRETRAAHLYEIERLRSERREVYVELIVAVRRADRDITRRMNDLVFQNDHISWDIEDYDRVWDTVTGEFSESSARARLVASEPVRLQLDAISSHFTRCVLALIESKIYRAEDPGPVLMLEELLARELDYRTTEGRE